MKYLNSFILWIILANVLMAQNQQSFNLVNVHSQGKLTVVNRNIEVLEEHGEKFVRLSEDKGEGLIWLPTKNFKTGTIEVQMRGKDILQLSFIGITFRGQNDSTYDAVYCRPFNFFAKDSVRRIHAVQYISHPLYTWEFLRQTRNAEFEKEIISPPDPNGWFTMKLVIDDNFVKTYINGAIQPSLVVKKLTQTKKGKVGIFVGSGSGGDFKSVSVKRIR